MKKLLFLSLLSLFALKAFAQVPVITAPSGWCCGQYLTVSGSWYKPTKGTPAPAYYSWDMMNSDQFGNPGSYVYNSGVIGGQPGGNYTYPNTWTYTSCGNYYLCQLGVSPDGIMWNYTTALVYCSPYPQPVITGNTITCGSQQATLCVNGLVNSEVVEMWTYWDYSCGCTAYLAGHGTTCVTLPAGYNGPVHVIVNNQYGCESTATVNVTNYVMDADFTVTTTSLGGGLYGATASRTTALPQISGYAETWHVEEVSGTSPYPAVTGTGLYNTAWNVPWWAANTNPPVNFSGYDGTNNLAYNDQTINVTSPAGKFVNGKMYRISHTVSNPNCSPVTVTKIIYQNGVWCSYCREANEHAAVEMENTFAFDVYPNPGNGSFQVRFAAAADNASAELFNALGERVDAFTVNGTEYSYAPAQTLAPGVYVLRVTNNGNVSSQRIVVQ